MAQHCINLCKRLCSAAYGVMAITFDSRNHGERTVDPLRNLDWPSNPTFPIDMYSLMMGNVYDLKLLINMLPCFISIDNVRWGVCGLSMGAHSALLAAFQGNAFLYQYAY